MMLGRAQECERLEHVIDAVLSGQGESLAVLGETGIGKSELLEHGAGYAAANGARVHRATGVEAEMTLPFAGLHQLLTPLLGGIGDLPRPRGIALARVFGLAEGPPPTLLLVALAALGLLEAAAVEAPVLCLIDDVQWIDHSSATALTVVSRRLGSSRIGLIFGVRQPVERRLQLAGVRELQLRGLSQEAAAELIRGEVDGPVADGVLPVLIAESGGNPSALLAVARGLTSGELAGTSLLPVVLPSTGFDLEHGLLRRVRQLPAETQTLLLVVAAERAGDVTVLSRAADRLGIPPDAVDVAEAEGLLRAEARITLRHPALRPAIYRSARARERRRVHRVLAAVMHGDLESDERIWHRAAASVVPDETIARELEGWSARLTLQLAHARAAELLTRASQLTQDPAARARRALGAARAEFDGGSPARSLQQLDSLVLDRSDPITQAQAFRLRASIGATLETGAGRPGRLLNAARVLAGLDAEQARDAYLDALSAAMDAGELGAGPDAVAVARAARAAPRVAASKRTTNDLLLEGLASLLLDGRVVAAPALRAAVDALREDDTVSHLGLGCRAAAELWDDEALRELALLRVDRARTSGVSALPQALGYLGCSEVLAGRLDIAEGHFDEADEREAALLRRGNEDRRESGRLLALAWRGRADETRALAETAKRNATARGLGSQVSLANHALCVLELGHRSYGAALSASYEALRSPTPFSGVATLPELVEAAVRADAHESAVDAARRLEASALTSGTEWGAGMLARTRALLATDNEAETLYLESIDHLKRCRVMPQLARTHLLYGEWLRRERRPRDSREELREAGLMFASMGAEAFARRAEEELHATGEHLVTRNPETVEVLTPQEVRVAELASGGESNREIAGRLYVSPRTVEYHLGKIFKKLGVSGRMELAQQLRTESVDRGENSTEELPLHGDEA